MKKKIVFFAFLLLALFTASGFAGDGVYVKVIEGAPGSYTEISAKVEAALKNSGWEILAEYNTGVPEDCERHSRVIIFTSPAYVQAIIAHGIQTVFAAPLRIGVYDDRDGVSVVLLNPVSINRTMVNKKKFEAQSLATLNSLSELIARAAASGAVVNKQLGAIRRSGRVGASGIGGGDFSDRIVTLYTSRDDSDANFKRIVKQVRSGIVQNRIGWKLIYTLDLSSNKAMLFGVSEEKIEGSAFTIARAQGSKLYKQVVLHHNTAFPMEIVVYKEDGRIKVVTLDEMYRMQLYFEDVGVWPFIMNIRKPNKIQEDIVELAISGLMQEVEN